VFGLIGGLKMDKHWQIFKWIMTLITSLSIGISFGPMARNISANTPPVVVLSPGHGWWSQESDQIDPGAVSGDLIEKDINLEVARNAKNYLSRCPVEVHLTRNGDDPDHTLEDVDEMVNKLEPTIGVSIHTNSGSGKPSGTEGWYTINGYDDVKSKLLAASLAAHISSRLQITNKGTIPETQSRHGGLYIHWWDAPSALIEIAYLQGDAELLHNKKVDFGRAIAQSILEQLNIDPHCADWAVPQGMFIATYYPGDKKVNEIELLNDGIMDWSKPDYFLVNQNNAYGAENLYPLASDTPVVGTATWSIPANAPKTPGIFRQEWQLMRGAERVGKKITIYLIVVPEEAKQVKEDIDQRIEKLRQQGEQEIDKFIEQLEKEAINWVTRKLPDLICGNQMILLDFAFGAALFAGRKRR